jgi:hypothetical protein
VFDGQPSVPVLPPPLLGEHDEDLLPDAGHPAVEQVDSAAAS